MEINPLYRTSRTLLSRIFPKHIIVVKHDLILCYD
jgi:hypothetical protein